MAKDLVSEFDKSRLLYTTRQSVIESDGGRYCMGRRNVLPVRELFPRRRVSYGDIIIKFYLLYVVI